MHRRSHSEVFCKKRFFENFAKFCNKTCLKKCFIQNYLPLTHTARKNKVLLLSKRKFLTLGRYQLCQCIHYAIAFMCAKFHNQSSCKWKDIYKSSHRRCSIKVGVLRPATLLKKILWHRTPFLQNTSKRLLLYLEGGNLHLVPILNFEKHKKLGWKFCWERSIFFVNIYLTIYFRI